MINKHFTCSRCVICVSCSVHVISMYYERKVSWAFYLNYPQFNEVRKSDHVVVIGTTVTLVDLRAVKLAQGAKHAIRLITEVKEIFAVVK